MSCRLFRRLDKHIMKIKSLKCPECGAHLEIDEGRTSCYCQYCGCKLILDDEKQECTINKNININRTTRQIDAAKILHEEYEEKKDKRDTAVGLIYGLGIPLAIILSIVLYFSISGGIAKSQGKIQAGYYKDLIGQDYKTVVAHFEAAGFENIEVIDLNDSGIAFWTDGEVVTISVGGDTDFESVDWFAPDTKVIISHH